MTRTMLLGFCLLAAGIAVAADPAEEGPRRPDATTSETATGSLDRSTPERGTGPRAPRPTVDRGDRSGGPGVTPLTAPDGPRPIGTTEPVSATEPKWPLEPPLLDWPAIDNAPPVDHRLVKRAEVEAERILERLTLRQKIGQITQGEIRFVSPALVEAYCLGSVLNGGGSWPNGNKYSTPQAWRDLADAYWRAGMDGCGIPPIWGTDSMHGASNVRGATLFPHNVGLGAADNPALMREIGRITARETRAVGIPWVFAPTVAVTRDDRWGRSYESYSEDPQLVARLAAPMIEGLQGDLGECSVAATIKHWIGDGGTTHGRDQGDTAVTEDELINIHGPGYFAGLDAGALSVMTSFSSWNGEKVHGDRYLITDVLKEQLGFTGHIVSDWNAIGQIDGCSNGDCPQAVMAGIDLFMLPTDWPVFIENTVDQVESGEIPMERIDDAVRRTLRTKLLMGLFDAPPSSGACAVDDELGAASHREVARAAVRESLVLLKNDGRLLPLSRDARILVTGKSANNIANQSGGWSITWQGTGNSNADFAGATSIWDGIREIAPDADWVPDPSSVDLGAYDAVIAVIGERPYAEGLGDIRSHQTLEHAKLTPGDAALLDVVHAADLPVVTVWVAGRPLYANKEINRSDAFVAAWLPGSEGGGIADVLFADEKGGINFDFTGKLPFAWPAEDCQTPLNAPRDKGALFPLGYGMGYRVASTLGELDESSGELGCVQRVDGEDAASEPLEIFVQGGNIDPWRIAIGDPSNWGGTNVDLSDQNAVTTMQNIKAGPRVDSPDFQAGGLRVSYSTDTPGVGPAQFYAQNTGLTGENLVSFLAAESGALVFDIRSDAPPTNFVEVRVDCGWPCFGRIFMTSAFVAIADGEWHELAVPLSCFANAGADFTNITAPFLANTSGRWEVDFANIRWEPDYETNVGCNGFYRP